MFICLLTSLLIVVYPPIKLNRITNNIRFGGYVKVAQEWWVTVETHLFTSVFYIIIKFVICLNNSVYQNKKPVCV